MQGPRRSLVLAGLLLGVLLAAVDATVIAVAMPAAVADLGGLHLYAWGFSAYMLATAATLPFWGAGSDRWGRRRLFLAGSAVLVAGSLACAMAPSMPLFIAARALQGVGAGAMFAIPMTILAVVYPPHLRGRALGVVTSAWGIASVLGPALGSVLVGAFGWRSVFYVNLPVGLAAAAIVAFSLEESRGRTGGKFDTAGAGLLSVAATCLLFAFTLLPEGGAPAWVAALVLGAACALALFIVLERRAENPVLPLHLFDRAGFRAGVLGSFAATFAVFGLVAFVPLEAARLHGVAGPAVVVTAIGIGWSGFAFATGRILHATGERRLVLPGMALLAVAAPLLALAIGSLPLAALAGFAVGTGMGLMTPSLTTSVQNSVDLEWMGVATGGVQLLRQIGSAVGVGAFGLAFHAGGLVAGSAVAVAAAVAGLAIAWRLPASSLAAA